MHAHIVQTENDMVKYVRDPAAALTNCAAATCAASRTTASDTTSV